MAIREVNYDVIQGDSFVLNLQYTNSNNLPIDITGCQVHLEVRDKPGGKILAAECNLNSGITVTNPTDGHINVNISPAKTRNFVFPKSAYQIQLTTPGNITTTLLTGWFSVNAGVIN